MLWKNPSLTSYFGIISLIQDSLGQFRNSQINVIPTFEVGTISNSLWKIYAEMLYVVLPLINFYQPEQETPSQSTVYMNFIHESSLYCCPNPPLSRCFKNIRGISNTYRRFPYVRFLTLLCRKSPVCNQKLSKIDIGFQPS